MLTLNVTPGQMMRIGEGVVTVGPVILDGAGAEFRDVEIVDRGRVRHVQVRVGDWLTALGGRFQIRLSTTRGRGGQNLAMCFDYPRSIRIAPVTEDAA